MCGVGLKLSLGKGEEMCFPKCLSSYLHGSFFLNTQISNEKFMLIGNTLN